jgi:phosphopantothenoylcysteine decarboxylase
MPNILLGVTGSVAAIKTPELASALRQAGHEVKIVATEASLYFFDPASIDMPVIRDADEWPGRESGKHWQRSDPVVHIELRRWAELLVIAPLDANTLAKLANGVSDNCLTCVWRAWDLNKPVLLAPAMNTLMWEHPFTVQHLRRLAKFYRLKTKKKHAADEVVNTIRLKDIPQFNVVGPISKALACGDVGQGAMAEVNDIVGAVQHLWTRQLHASTPASSDQ